MNNIEYDKFLGKLYDILLRDDIISYEDKAKDLKTKKERLEKYLDKIKKVQDKALNKDKLDLIKKLYYDRYIIKRENIPDTYFQFLERRYLEEGHGHVNLVNPNNEEDRRLKEEHINTVIKEQKDSLDNWLNYLLSSDSSYLPMWAKVWAFQGMLHIGNLNENKDGYKTRGKTTINPFVSFDSEILGKCVELLEESINKKDITDEEIDKIVASGSFAKLYGKLLANKKVMKIESDEGIWIKYNQETEKEITSKEENNIEPEYMKLYNSLQGYNTGWCTAGSRETAKNQICGGDFYVYYTKDKNGEYKVPRIAIRMEGNQIGEIRGIADSQNIESNMEKVIEEKLKEFPDAKKYQKKVTDMKLLTEIYNKHLNKKELSKEELRFLYEIDEEIIGFGYGKDPRINEILNDRHIKKDLSFILNCTEDEIGLTEEDLNRNLVYFYGNLDLNHLTSIDGLILPQYIRGSLSLDGLTSAEGLTLPQSIEGDLSLRGLTDAKGLVLPQNIRGSLFLDSLTSAEGLILPQSIGDSLSLNSLTIAEGLTLPQSIEGSLFLDSLTIAEGLTLPQSIGGSLWLDGLTSAEGLILPQNIRYLLSLNSLTSAEGLTFPQSIGDSLSLKSLTSAEGLTLPQSIGGSLTLDSLTNAEGLTLPQSIGDSLSLKSLTSAEGLTLPQSIGGSLWLDGLTNAEGLTLPQSIGGSLWLDGLTSAEGLILPQNIRYLLSLNSLTSAEGLTLPQSIRGALNLNGLTSAEGLVLPQSMDGTLYLNGLTSAEGLVLPQRIGGLLSLERMTSLIGLVIPKEASIGNIYYQYNEWSLQELIELQKKEEKKYVRSQNFNHLKLSFLRSVKKWLKGYSEDKPNKKRGFVSGILVVGVTITICILSIILGVIMIK